MTHLGFAHSLSEIARRWDLVSDPARDPVLLAELDGRPIGLLALHVAPLLFYPAPLARITTLVVSKAHRRQGIGRRLVADAVRIAKAAGCDTVELTTGLMREDAHRFYRALGFEATSLRMTLTL